MGGGDVLTPRSWSKVKPKIKEIDSVFSEQPSLGNTFLGHTKHGPAPVLPTHLETSARSLTIPLWKTAVSFSFTVQGQSIKRMATWVSGYPGGSGIPVLGQPWTTTETNLGVSVLPQMQGLPESAAAAGKGCIHSGKAYRE